MDLSFPNSMHFHAGGTVVEAKGDEMTRLVCACVGSWISSCICYSTALGDCFHSLWLEP